MKNVKHDVAIIPTFKRNFLLSMVIYNNNNKDLEEYFDNQKCTLEQLQRLIVLCPWLEHIKINPHIESLESIFL